MDELKPLIFDATEGSALFQRMVATGKYEFLHAPADGPIPKSRRVFNADGTFTYPGLMIRMQYPDGETALFMQPWLNAEAQDKHPAALIRKDVANLAADAYRGTLFGRRVVIVGDLGNFRSLMFTYDVCNAALDEEAMELTLVVSKDSLPKDKFRARAILQLLAKIPHTPAGNRLVTVDEKLPGVPVFTRVKLPRRNKPITNDTAFDLFGDKTKAILLPTGSYHYLAERMMEHGNFEMGEYETEMVEGRPFFKKLKTNVAGRRVVIVSGTIDDRETMELHYMSTKVAEEGALSLQRILGFARRVTQERKTKSGELVGAKSDARLLSSPPRCQLRNRVIFLDLHSEGFPHYLEDGVQHQHVYVGKHLVTAVARKLLGLPFSEVLGKNDIFIDGANLLDLVLAATDSGRAKWVESMGIDINLRTAFGRKERDPNNDIVFLGALGDVLLKMALVYDDKWGTGNTSVKATLGIRIDQYGGRKALNELKRLQAAGHPVEKLMESIVAVSHFVGDEKTVDKALAAKDELGSPVFSKFFGVDSHPMAYKHAGNPRYEGRFFAFTSALLLAKAVAD